MRFLTKQRLERFCVEVLQYTVQYVALSINQSKFISATRISPHLASTFNNWTYRISSHRSRVSESIVLIHRALQIHGILRESAVTLLNKSQHDFIYLLLLKLSTL